MLISALSYIQQLWRTAALSGCLIFLWFEVTAQSVFFIKTLQWVVMPFVTAVCFFSISIHLKTRHHEDHRMVFSCMTSLRRTSPTMSTEDKSLQWRCLACTFTFSVLQLVAVFRRQCMPLLELGYKEIPLSLISCLLWWRGRNHHTVLSWGLEGGESYESERRRKENCHSSNPPISLQRQLAHLFLKARADLLSAGIQNRRIV